MGLDYGQTEQSPKNRQLPDVLWIFTAVCLTKQLGVESVNTVQSNMTVPFPAVLLLHFQSRRVSNCLCTRTTSGIVFLLNGTRCWRGSDLHSFSDK